MAGLIVAGLVLGVFFAFLSTIGSIIESRPLLLWKWVVIAVGAITGLFPLNLRSVPFQGAELALRLFEGDPEKHKYLVTIRKDYSGWVTGGFVSLEGASVELALYQTYRAARAKRWHDRGIEAANQEKAALAFAQKIINMAHKQETF